MLDDNQRPVINSGYQNSRNYSLLFIKPAFKCHLRKSAKLFQYYLTVIKNPNVFRNCSNHFLANRALLTSSTTRRLAAIESRRIILCQPTKRFTINMIIKSFCLGSPSAIIKASATIPLSLMTEWSSRLYSFRNRRQKKDANCPDASPRSRKSSLSALMDFPVRL